MNQINFPVNTVKASITSFFLFKLEMAKNTFHLPPLSFLEIYVPFLTIAAGGGNGLLVN